MEALGTSGRTSTVQVQTIFLREDRQDLQSQLPPAVEIVLLSHDVFDHASATEHSQGVAALLRHIPAVYVPKHGDLLLVVANLQDPGNLGTLIRSAEAFGAAAVVLTAGTVDPWNGKALRASAGSTFRVPLLSWTEDLQAVLRSAGVRLLAAVPLGQNAVPASQARLTEGCAIVVGNEGSGIPKEFLALCDAQITLPMVGETESLNAAVAGSVLLYEAARQRS